MPYTGEFVLHCYVQFSQIRSHTHVYVCNAILYIQYVVAIMIIYTRMCIPLSLFDTITGIFFYTNKSKI